MCGHVVVHSGCRSGEPVCGLCRWGRAWFCGIQPAEHGVQEPVLLELGGKLQNSRSLWSVVGVSIKAPVRGSRKTQADTMDQRVHSRHPELAQNGKA